MKIQPKDPLSEFKMNPMIYEALNDLFYPCEIRIRTRSLGILRGDSMYDRPLHVDFLVPAKKLVIEYNGPCSFDRVNTFKKSWCRKNAITFLSINHESKPFSVFKIKRMIQRALKNKTPGANRGQYNQGRTI